MSVNIESMIVHNQMAPNGKTIRQNNLEIMHTIPLGTLVEVDLHYNESHGVRMFVCEHTRDCDGEPMYALYHSNDFGTLHYVKEQNYHVYRAMINDGFTAGCLKVIRNV